MEINKPGGFLLATMGNLQMKNLVEKDERGMLKIEDKIHIPKNSLDVLAQQIFGMAIVQPLDINELYKSKSVFVIPSITSAISFPRVFSF